MLLCYYYPGKVVDVGERQSVMAVREVWAAPDYSHVWLLYAFDRKCRRDAQHVARGMGCPELAWQLVNSINRATWNIPLSRAAAGYGCHLGVYRVSI
jgi:hypothetical protein